MPCYVSARNLPEGLGFEVERGPKSVLRLAIRKFFWRFVISASGGVLEV